MYKNFVIIIFLIHIIVIISSISPKVIFAFEDPAAALMDKIGAAEEKADLQHRTINSYYFRGKAHYQRGDYAEAIVNFEALLKIDSNYEAAKLYLECAILQQKIEAQEAQIESIKLQMADIIAEYEGRIKTVGGLSLGYLLEQALLKCQASDFDGARYYYNLCYKLEPKNIKRLEWFVDATDDLESLSADLDVCYKKIEELAKTEVINKLN